jgi:thymidylate synthase (FAD)
VKMVQPTVRLISRPSIDWEQIRAFLDEVGGLGWADRVQPQDSPDAEDLAEFAGRECYRSWEPGLNPNVVRVREDSPEYLQNVIASMHGSVLEHANFTFVLHNVSRVLTHELVRHRAGSAYSQESLRFVRLDDLPFWFPDWALADAELMARSLTLLQQMEEHQQWMAEHFGLDDDGVPFSEKKHRTSFMRRLAPEGLATGIVWTVNVRAARHVIEARTAAGAEEEIRLVFDQVARILQAEVPALLADYTQVPVAGSDVPAWEPGTRKV